MKAVVLHAYGPPSNLKYEDFADPSPNPGEVLVRVHAAGVNPIDWKIRSGATASRFTTTFPAILGYDFAGTVQALGDGVTGFAAGDRVFGRTANCYAELTTVKATELAKVPEGLDLTVAGGIATPSTTADQLIHEAVNAQADQTILLTGALGSVGRIALYAAVESGVKVIAGVRKQQIAEAIALGATAAIDIGDPAALSSLGTVDAVADAIGGPLANKLIGHVKPGGNYGALTGPPSDAALNPTVHVHAFGSHPDAKAMLHYAEAIRDGKLKFPVDLLLPLADAAEAHTKGEKGGIGKIVLTA
jgi:NADPH:quinone reductase-like Zn-dependent oxidoreductase